jgi:NitT/TauT family transport system substrate-binding protein
LLFLLFFGAGWLCGGAHAAQNVTLVLNSPPNGLHTAVIYTQRKGFYTRAGLLVTIERGRGSGHTVRTLHKREMAFGVAEMAAVVESRAEGLDLAGLALLMERYPGSLIALESSGIRSPADLPGKRLAGSVSSFSRILFPSFAERAGLRLDRMRWANIGPQSEIRALLTGKADAIVTSEVSRWRYDRAAGRRKKTVTSLLYTDQGMEVYGLSLLAPVRLIEEQEDIVRRMVEATVRGQAEAMSRPAEALDLFRRSFPDYPPEGAKAEWRVFVKSWSAQGLKKPGLGFYDKRKVGMLQSLLIRGRQLTKKFAVESFFTNRFVPKVSVRPVSF